MARDRKQSLAMPRTTRLSGQALSGERQQAVSGYALDHWAIRAGPQWRETESSHWLCLGPLGYQGRPSVARDSKQSVAMPWTTGLSGQALSGERQKAVIGYAFDH